MNKLTAEGKKMGLGPVRWTIPDTEITLIRVADGPRSGQFLFSPSPVSSTREFYDKTLGLPYRRDIPLKGYTEMRPYMERTHRPTGNASAPSSRSGCARPRSGASTIR